MQALSSVDRGAVPKRPQNFPKAVARLAVAPRAETSASAGTVAPKRLRDAVRAVLQSQIEDGLEQPPPNSTAPCLPLGHLGCEAAQVRCPEAARRQRQLMAASVSTRQRQEAVSRRDGPADQSQLAAAPGETRSRPAPVIDGGITGRFPATGSDSMAVVRRAVAQRCSELHSSPACAGSRPTAVGDAGCRAARLRPRGPTGTRVRIHRVRIQSAHRVVRTA